MRIEHVPGTPVHTFTPGGSGGCGGNGKGGGDGCGGGEIPSWISHAATPAHDPAKQLSIT